MKGLMMARNYAPQKYNCIVHGTFSKLSTTRMCHLKMVYNNLNKNAN